MKTWKFILPLLLLALVSLSAEAQQRKKVKVKTKKQKAAKPANLKNKEEKVVTITTSLGEIKLLLFDETPKHKENFLKNAESGFYNGTTFHRVINGFMIQGGDPNSKDQDPYNDGMGNPGYTIPAEIKPELRHVQGAVAAARQGDNINPKRDSNGSQFYIVENPAGTPFLDGQYTVFGQVISGYDVVTAISNVPKDRRDRPEKDIKMTVQVDSMKRKDIIKRYKYNFEQPQQQKEGEIQQP